ncbi:peptidoglycan editing factor PgeF [Roseofilum casamattae]|uniref:Purine nucleoside phosphorylase n=1 Tax=Roseofilum casamattae BLCC-M143 TaxID=3022442 RepID=A0ABT7BTY8_9CYAN|nr:peptidoglycan editing factor PgeF [Roseofilum casamattae]MDJ1182649.1 peptidoglycan editing factor PgeF [Roseofilum casamattae BLCC-M143]
MSPTWHWQTVAGLSYLTCSLLSAWKHGFFTRQFHGKAPEDLSLLLDPRASAYRIKQVHGNRVLKTGEVAPLDAPSRSEADGLLSEEPNQSIWVCSADCVPVLIGDRTTGRVAALHAGWRGTAARIVPRAIADLQDRGSQLEDLCIALGPAISGAVYQVGLDVAEQMAASLEGSHTIATLSEGKHPVFLPDREPDRVRLDVRQVNCRQLQQLGITTEQIAIAPYCTYQDPERFFSYRRDGLKFVQWSGIVDR